MLKIFIPGEREQYGNYERALTGCGAQAVFGSRPDDGEDCDGLLLPGGADVNPARYGEQNTASVGIDDARDALETALIRRFFAQNKPILGICRGHQALNVAFGGSLIQDVENVRQHARCGRPDDQAHRIVLCPDSFLAGLYADEADADGGIFVNSAHHQAVKAIAPGFRVAARSDDGLIEAIEHEQAPVLGVQFHPERMSFANRRADTVDGRAVIEYFLSLCGASCNV